MAKGLSDVIQTLDVLINRGLDVRLILAGPCSTAESKRIVEGAMQRFGKHLEYRGPVYDNEKAQFYDEIDAFLFPTRNESWGIVLNEALAAGAPVISVDRGCVSCLVGDGGCVLDAEVDFAVNAARHVEQWVREPDAYARLQQLAVARGIALEEQAKRGQAELVRAVVN